MEHCPKALNMTVNRRLPLQRRDRSMGRHGADRLIEAGALTVVLPEKRQAIWDIGHVQSVGLTPADYHIVAKSAVAWKTAFGPAAKAVIQVDSPGCCSFNLRHFRYDCLRRPLNPLYPVTDWR